MPPARLLVVMFHGERSLLRSPINTLYSAWQALWEARKYCKSVTLQQFELDIREIKSCKAFELDGPDYWSQIRAKLAHRYSMQRKEDIDRVMTGLRPRLSRTLHPDVRQAFKWLHDVKRQTSPIKLATPWQAAIVGMLDLDLVLDRGSQVAEKLSVAGLSIKGCHKNVREAHHYDLDFIKYTDALKTPSQRVNSVHDKAARVSIQTACLDVKNKIENSSLAGRAEVDLLFVSRSSTANQAARQAGWNSLRLLGSEHVTSGLFDNYRGQINRNANDTLLRARGPEDVIYDLRDLHLWRPSGLA